MFDFSVFAADQERYNLSFPNARKIAQVYTLLGFGNPRIFAEAKPNAMPPGVLLIPEKAQKGDESRWPDRGDVDTSGNDLTTMFGADDPGDTPMFLQISVDGTEDFFTAAPWYKNLTDPKKASSRVQWLSAMKHEVQISSGQKMSDADESVLAAVNAALGV